MKFSDEVLMAYADGELTGELRAEVQQAIETDPQIAQRVARHQALRRSVQAHFAGVLAEPVPQRLIAASSSAAPVTAPASDAIAQDASKVVPLRRARFPRWSLPQWAAVAASFVLGAGAWQLINRGAGSLIVERAGHLVAVGSLEQALSDQLVAAQSAGSPVQIGISFRSNSGGYCRTFRVPSAAYAGLACRSDEQWRIQLLGRNESASTNPSGYRQAASALPPWLAQEVESSIAGEPLDAGAEARARAERWRGQPSPRL
jgi:hypothetical protein